MKKNIIKKIIHYISNFHFLTGWNLIHVDPRTYPYCKICGAKPNENYSFAWYSKTYLKARDSVLEYNGK